MFDIENSGLLLHETNDLANNIIKSLMQKLQKRYQNIDIIIINKFKNSSYNIVLGLRKILIQEKTITRIISCITKEKLSVNLRRKGLTCIYGKNYFAVDIKKHKVCEIIKDITLKSKKSIR